MSGLSLPRLRRLVARHDVRPKVFAETGTFHGERAALACAVFERVLTCELSPALHAEAAATYDYLPITFVLGDSRDVIRRWAVELTEPVCWYLDAHWFTLNPNRTRAGAERDRNGGIAGQAEGLPLWDELDALATRPYPDIIVVDDARDFGTDKPTPEWRDVSLEAIAARFPDHREAVILHDQAVVYR